MTARRCSMRSGSPRSTSCSRTSPSELRLGRAARASRRDAGERGPRPPRRAGRAKHRCRRRGQLPRRRHVRPLRAGDRRRDHQPLGVPDALHALPARGLAGRAAGDVRVPDRDVRADRARRLQRRAVRGALGRRLRGLPGDRRHRPQEAGRLARPASAQPRDDGHLLGRLRHRGRRGRPRRRRHRRRRARGGDRRGDRGGLPPAAELPRLGRGRRGARRARQGEGGAGGRLPATRSRSRC